MAKRRCSSGKTGSWKLLVQIKMNLLFNLRKELPENFSFDILTQNTSNPNQFLIPGFYKNEEGLEQARNLPVIKEWAKNNPPAKFSATDLFTPKRFRIISNP